MKFVTLVCLFVKARPNRRVLVQCRHLCESYSHGHINGSVIAVCMAQSIDLHPQDTQGTRDSSPGYLSVPSLKIVCFHVQVFRSQQPPRAEVLNNAGVRYHRTHAQIVSDLTVEIKSVACWKLACAQMTDIRLFYMTNTAVRHYLIR